MSHLAQDASVPRSAQEVSQALSISLPTVSKLLKKLAIGGLLRSVRGARGGYTLARAPEAITLIDVIDALEGAFSLTECSAGEGLCGQEGHCRVRGNWILINRVVRSTLEGVSLAAMSGPPEGVRPRVN